MHNHNHDHHGHSHAHAPRDFGTAFALGTAINLAFVCLEATFGFIANSTALLADAGHNLSDVLGLVVAWAGYSLAKRPPTERFTYGMRGSSILAALANAIFLLVAVGAIGWEAVRRLAAPEPVLEGYVMAVAAAGVIVNGVTAWLFFSGREHDINIRGAFLHMAADAAISVGVVISAALIMFTGWLWLDPATSLLIMVVIVAGTWGLLRESVNMSLAGVPKSIVLDDVRKSLLAIPGVDSVHDLHVWPMSTTETALTVHVVVPDAARNSGVLAEISRVMHETYSIDHCTTQIEKIACEQCERGRMV